ncbi:hypothetical protein LC724_10565 [Blautia sp. RD014234]|nr:hypothetical protein [Blautia parvula]
MKVLIAEDDENMSRILKLYLEREGTPCRLFLTGRTRLIILKRMGRT